MEVEIAGVVKTADNNQVHYVANDDRASYTLVNPKAPDDYQPQVVDWVPQCKVDYDMPKNTQTQGLPQSYLQIQSVTDAQAWFKQNTKYPDLVCDMLAKYEFGDLKYTTKKEFKNLRKKINKKKSKQTTLKVKRAPVVLTF